MSIVGKLTDRGGEVQMYKEVLPGKLVGHEYAPGHAVAIYCEPDDSGGLLFVINAAKTGLSAEEAALELQGIEYAFAIGHKDKREHPLEIDGTAVGQIALIHTL